MKSKISVKLAVIFATMMLTFTLLIGFLFITLFNDYTLKMVKTEMSRQATTMAQSVSELLTDTSQSGMHGPGMGMGGGMGSLGSYINHISDIVEGNVWLVDTNKELIQGQGRMAINYEDLPADGITVIEQAFYGETVFSQGFSKVLNVPTMTVGTPILNGGSIVGVLLLHSPVSGVTSASDAIINLLLISGGITLVLAIALSSILAFTMTKPLKQMKQTASQLIDGNYEARSEVKSRDEIGELAFTLDILAQRLQEAKKASDEFEKSRQDFITTISHELKTPVTVITGSLQSLHDKVVSDPAQVESYHRQMLSESKVLERLVNDLLDLSRLQNVDFKMEHNTVYVSELLSDVVRSGKQLAIAKDIKIELSVDNTSKSLWGDYGRLRQMLLLVLDNAIKFSNHHSKVEVSLKDNRISITDYGLGIKPDELQHIFERFYQVKPDRESGTGLGLAIAAQIAKRHDIEISVTSDTKTTFTFTLKKDS